METLSDEALRSMRAAHKADDWGSCCLVCDGDWPCDAQRLIADLQQTRARLAQAEAENGAMMQAIMHVLSVAHVKDPSARIDDLVHEWNDALDRLDQCLTEPAASAHAARVERLEAVASAAREWRQAQQRYEAAGYLDLRRTLSVATEQKRAEFIAALDALEKEGQSA